MWWIKLILGAQLLPQLVKHKKHHDYRMLKI